PSFLENRTKDPRCDCSVKRLGPAVQSRGDGDAPGQETLGMSRYAIAFVADNNDPFSPAEIGLENILAIHYCAINRQLRELQEQRFNSPFNTDDPQECAHGGLYSFGVVGVDTGRRAEDVSNAEPVGNAQDSAEITGVLYAV